MDQRPKIGASDHRDQYRFREQYGPDYCQETGKSRVFSREQQCCSEHYGQADEKQTEPQRIGVFSKTSRLLAIRMDASLLKTANANTIRPTEQTNRTMEFIQLSSEIHVRL